VTIEDIRYRYSAVPTIKRFSQSRTFIRGLMGPVGSGKSSGCVIELVRWGARQTPMTDGKRRARFAVIRNTYQQLNDTTIKTFHQWVPPHEFGTYMKSDHTYLIDRFEPDLEIEILFRALDRPEQVANLLSLELTGAWVNEAREVPYAVIKALQGRVGRYPAVKDGGCVDAGIVLDSNPPAEDSWWYELFEVNRPDTAEIFKQPSGISPEAENKIYLPEGYYEKQMAGADEDYIKVYVRGEYGFVRDGKPIYTNYNDSLHCLEVEPIRGIPIKCGWDFGLTPACVFTQVTPKGDWLILDELCGDDIGIGSFADCVLEMRAQHFAGFAFEDYGDPAGDSRSSMTADKDEKTCYDILRGKGIAIRPGEQNLTIRLESVRKPLATLREGGKPQLQLHPRCEILRKGFQGRYQYKRLKIAGAAERYRDEPDKNEYSHPHDALQYVATKIFGDAVRGKQERAKRERSLEELYPGYTKKLTMGVI
jgi:hypothetical protein